mgnify:CR=1 FL=1
MSLGWLNLQDYLGANAGNLDAQATQLDERAFAMPEGKTSMPYGEFLARRRQRNDETGAAALLGGDATDALLARKGKSSYAAPNTYDPAAKARQDEANRKAEADYWDKAAVRNQGLAVRDADEKRKQQESFDAARRATGRTSGYGSYSNAVGRSFDESRGRQIRTISEEEYNAWTR